MTEGGARILVVDDDPANIEVIAGIFEDGDYEVQFATDGERALELAVSSGPDVVLLDVMMPGMDGFEVCRRLQSQRATSGIAVIFITGMGDLEAEAQGLELGAVDYVTKPINPPVVRRRVDNQIELKRARDRLAQLAITDGLTQIANRRHFDDTLAREYARLARNQQMLSLVLVDLDHFKEFNDSYGHISGDDCLRAVARVIDSAASRPADLAARYGGEEFACILPDTDREGAVAIAERIREGVSALGIVHDSSPSGGYVTASAGVGTVRCQPDRSPLNVVAIADEQLYAAKAAGRDRVAAPAPEDA